MIGLVNPKNKKPRITAGPLHSFIADQATFSL